MSLIPAPLLAAWLALWLAQASPQLTPEVMAKPAQLFPVAAATAGAGPAVIEYWLDGPSRRVQLAIMTSTGTGVAALVPGRRRGVNTVRWDMRIVPPGIDTKEVRKEAKKGLRMPLTVPGDYVVRLIVDGAAQSQPFRVNDDPRLKMSPVERRTWTDTQVRLWQTAFGAEQQKEAVKALGEQARQEPGTRLKATVSSLKKLEQPLEEIAEHAEGLLKKVIAMTRPIGAGDLAKSREYAGALEKRRLEVRALQDTMRQARR